MLTPRTAILLVALALGGEACASDSGSSNATSPTTASSVTTSVAPSATEAPGTTETQVIATAAAAAEAADASATTDPPPSTDAALTSPASATEDAAKATDAPTTEAPQLIEVLVTGDDGYDAPGMDAVVEYLRSRGDMQVSVWAPLTNQSGAGDQTSATPPAVTDVTTISGYPAKAVAGFPADSVAAALNGGMSTRPDLIISGSNLGQNYGLLSTISGTVGAAATGARAGIPAIAISQGFPAEGADYDFPASVAVLTQFLDANLELYLNGTSKPLVNINVPTCPVGVALLETIDYLPSAVAANDRQLGAPTLCDGNPAVHADDIDGFNAGHPVVTEIDSSTLVGVVVQP